MYTHNNSKFQSPEHRTPEPLLLTQYTHYKEDYIVSTTTSVKVYLEDKQVPLKPLVVVHASLGKLTTLNRDMSGNKIKVRTSHKQTNKIGLVLTALLSLHI